jgi:glycosyltransferase involved in cell wall biosynthesis
VETFYEEHFRTLADATTVISHALGERAESLGVDPKTIFWIPNGCPVDMFHVVSAQKHRREYGLPEDAFILADSALDVFLGTAVLMQALQLIVKTQPDVLLLMTGGRQRELRLLAEKHGIDGHFIHLGALPYTEVPKAMSCADVFVMPYPDRPANRGRWPGRIGSYLALGRPVISNPVGEVKLLFEKEPIGLLAAERPEDLAEKILLLKNDPALRRELGTRARMVAEKLTWSKMTDDLESCYDAAVRHFALGQG